MIIAKIIKSIPLLDVVNLIDPVRSLTSKIVGFIGCLFTRLIPRNSINIPTNNIIILLNSVSHD